MPYIAAYLGVVPAFPARAPPCGWPARWARVKVRRLLRRADRKVRLASLSTPARLVMLFLSRVSDVNESNVKTTATSLLDSELFLASKTRSRTCCAQWLVSITRAALSPRTHVGRACARDARLQGLGSMV